MDVQNLAPHLVVKHEQVIVQCQGGSADQQVLYIGSVLHPGSLAIAELTFSIKLKTEIIASASVLQNG